MRGDAETVARHIDEIGNVSPQTADLYVALARVTARRAVDAGLLRAGDGDAVLEAIEAAGGRAMTDGRAHPGRAGRRARAEWRRRARRSRS